MKFYKRILCLVFTLLSILTLLSPAAAAAARKVRIGYMNHPGFIEKNENGEFFGYGVEYFEKICEYVNWKIEYVFAPWTQQLEMLESGELDLVPMAQYSEERAQKYDYCAQSMGIIQCILFTSSAENGIYYEDYYSFDGKTIGIMRGVRNKDFLKTCANMMNFSYKLREYELQTDLEEALAKREVDIICGEQMTTSGADLRIVARISSDPFYTISAKGREQLMNELNYALGAINCYDPTYTAQLYKKYYGSSSSNILPAFTKTEAGYIKQNPTQELYLLPNKKPYSYIDDKGNPAGIAVDYMNFIGEKMGVSYTYKFIPDTQNYMDFLKENKDAVLVGVHSGNAKLNIGYVESDTIYTGTTKVVFSAKQIDTLDMRGAAHKVGIVNYRKVLLSFIEKEYPNLEVVIYESTEEGLKALEAGKIDAYIDNSNILTPYLVRPIFGDLSFLPGTFMTDEFCILTYYSPDSFLQLNIADKCISCITEEDFSVIESNKIVNNGYEMTLGDFIYKYKFALFIILILLTALFSMFIYVTVLDRKNAHAMKKKNRDLAEAAKKAEAATEAKTRFLSQMSHDIRTPMNAITGMALLAKREKDIPPAIMSYLNIISSSAHLLLGLLNDILDSAAIESGKLKIVNKPFNITEFLDEMDSIFSSQYAEKNINYISENEAIVDTHLIGDKMRLEQIGTNLLSNAYKFTESGGTVTVKTVQLGRSEDGKALFRLTVEDTGSGISEEALPHIFDAFEQGDEAHKRKNGGSGLGLNIAKSLVEMMGGSIKVESTLGVGTKFTIELAYLIDKDYVAEKDGENAEAAAVFDFGGKRILVADDDEFNRQVVGGLLGIVNAKIDIVENGQEALDLFMKSDASYYSAILLDVHMPLMGGYETTECIRSSAREDAKSVPIYALTADVFPDDVAKALECGMNGHLTKPIEPDILYEVLAEAMG